MPPGRKTIPQEFPELKKLIYVITTVILSTAVSLAQSITVTSPTAGVTVTSPVHFAAKATGGGHSVTAMRVYVDSKSMYTVHNTTVLNTSLPLAQGSHVSVVKAWNSAGKVISKSIAFTVTSGPAPTPTPTPSPTPTPAPTPNPTPSPTPSGTNYYVASNGNDANNGTSAAPWATLQHAANVARAGSVVHVASGTYGAVTTSASGTSSARIRFISDVKWGAKIRTTGLDQMWNNTANYVDIMGFDISGDGRLGILNTGSFVRIVGNNVHNIPAACNGSGGAGIDNANYSGTDNDIIGNVVHDIGNPAVQCFSVQGIYHSNLRGHILNNISYRNQAWGIHLWHAANNVVVSNNLVFQNGEGGIVIGDGDSPGGVTNDNTTVSNNIVMDNQSSWGAGLAIYETGATGTHNKYLNNLIWNNPAGIVLQNALQDLDTVNADPLLVNYQPAGGGDYHLQPTSRAVNSGTTQGMPSEDFDGAPRPVGSGPDRGPYEFDSAATPWPWM